MNPDKQQQIFDACPIIFRERKTTRYPLMFGIEAPDGWFEPIMLACQQLEAHAASESTDKQAMYIIHQIKEKFGGLRLYTADTNSKIRDIIVVAEESCSTMCEMCGGVGTVHRDHWHRTLCDPCEEKYQKERRGNWP